jgi:hypothetical protein
MRSAAVRPHPRQQYCRTRTADDNHEAPSAAQPQQIPFARFAILRALRLCVRQITHAKAQSSPRRERTHSFDTASLSRSKKFAQGAKILTDSSTKDTKLPVLRASWLAHCRGSGVRNHAFGCGLTAALCSMPALASGLLLGFRRKSEDHVELSRQLADL